eukprot:scaffold1177_cov126-Isochrysis_galbana.AAC.9
MSTSSTSSPHPNHPFHSHDRLCVASTNHCALRILVCRPPSRRQPARTVIDSFRHATASGTVLPTQVRSRLAWQVAAAPLTTQP